MKRTDPKQPFVWLVLVGAVVAWIVIFGVLSLLLN